MLLKVITGNNAQSVTIDFKYGFKLQKSVSNGCHDLQILGLDISDITIITVEGIDYHCFISDINKSNAIEKIL